MSDTPPEAETLGAYLKAARVKAGLTLADLGGRIGVSAQSVHKWESDENTPSGRALHFLAKELPDLDPAKMLALIPSATR